MQINKINREQYHEQHLIIHNDLHDEFKAVISKYNSFGTKTKNKSFDITTKSELIRLSDFRDEGAGAKEK